MINAFKAEWRKLRQRPAVWILGAILLVALVLSAMRSSGSRLRSPRRISTTSSA